MLPAVTPQGPAADSSVLDPFQHLSFLTEKQLVDTPRRTAKRTVPVRKAKPTASGLDAQSTAYFDALCTRWGLHATRYRSSIFLRRRAATLRALKVSDMVDGLHVIHRDQGAAERALGAVMIGVTSFFRDPAVFNELAPLLRKLHEQSRKLDVVSMGCSDGSEMYSVAMLLVEAGLLGDARLLGIDCRPSAIAAATKGVYPLKAAELVPDALRQRYLEPVHQSMTSRRFQKLVRVHQTLRDACQWKVADAFASPREHDDFEKAHVILCRNLAIYLTPESASDLWSRLVDRLHCGGLLVVGKAERPPATLQARLTRLSRCIYVKEC